MIRAFLLSGVLSALGLSVLAYGQTVIENPANPASRSADRIVELKEVLRITDEGGEFFFKYPSLIQVGPDGSIFAREQEQLLKFDRTGQFLRNYFRKGQGPGEVLYISGFLPLKSGVIVQSSYPPKMIWYGEDGVAAKVATLQSPIKGFTMIGQGREGFLFSARSHPFENLKGTNPAVVEVRCSILSWAEGEAGLREQGVFPIESYVIPSGTGGGGILPLSEMYAVLLPDGRLALTHTQEYLIKIFDVQARTVIRSFRRAYERVRFVPPKEGGVVINGTAYTHAPRKYASDVEALYSVGDQIWAVTSRRDKDGLPSIDVFDLDGRYLDRFYLRRPAAAKHFLWPSDCVIRDGCLYHVEWREDDIPSVAKYEIRDPAAPARGK
jgi:hypothetical protein